MRTAPDSLYIAGPRGGQPYCKVCAAAWPLVANAFGSCPNAVRRAGRSGACRYGYHGYYAHGYHND